jgi:murein DD-endopeptidase MepM/ murein hydrolase activator NlpD
MLATPVAQQLPDLPTATLPPVNTSGPLDLYQSQGGDTLNIVATRFAVSPGEIISDVVLPPAEVLIPAGTTLLIPKTIPEEQRTPRDRTIPDSEVVYGPSALDFNIDEYVTAQNGTLASYKEYLISGGWTTGAQAVERIALENSLNPRMILAIIEFESRWVRGQPTNLAQDEYPLGYVDYHYRGLFRQLMWAAGTLSEGYYGWRSGSLTEITFRDGSRLRLNPNLNAGTAAIQYYFAQTHSRAEWEQIVSTSGFPALYTDMYGPPWERASAYEPTIPDGLRQPELSLPFEPGKIWAFTGGPHSAWEEKGAMAALDFAPGSLEQGCVKSDNWVLAPAAGVVARTAEGVVILDLDGDGKEQTGWVLLFLHISTNGKVKTGDTLEKDDKIGHPSCEGGVATGTHVHIARKYNGEWVLADGPIPFNLDGWISRNGDAPYKGTLTKDDKVITASTSGSFETRIIRDKK